MNQKLSKQFIKKAQAVTAKRAKTVIDHILLHGQITTDELKRTYGYNHPPRAARDVREQGIGLKTIRVKGPDGRQIGAYVFDETATQNYSRRTGRTAFSNHLKEQLIKQHGAKCFIYLETTPEHDLQIDHRIPYEVAGDATSESQSPDDFMLLCGSANRAKSWSCEHCSNWLIEKNLAICRTCYWAYPECYSHVATLLQRRLDILWTDTDVAQYERVRSEAEQSGLNMPDFVKQALQKMLR